MSRRQEIPEKINSCICLVGTIVITALLGGLINPATTLTTRQYMERIWTRTNTLIEREICGLKDVLYWY